MAKRFSVSVIRPIFSRPVSFKTLTFVFSLRDIISPSIIVRVIPLTYSEFMAFSGANLSPILLTSTMGSR